MRTSLLRRSRADESALARLAALSRDLVAALRGRRAVADLAESDDHLLADVGLSRADISRAFERPATSDPSAHLALIVEARRADRR